MEISKIYFIFGIILLFCSSLFLVGCSTEGSKEISYEIINFEDAPKEVQERISETVSNNNHLNGDYSISGSVDLNKEQYEFFIASKNRVPKIIEVAPDQTYGIGLLIKRTDEYKENVEFPDTVKIVKFNDYYGKITNVFISNP